MPPLQLLIKPASGNCNVRCRYCFYADEMNLRAAQTSPMLSEDLSRQLIRRALAYAEGNLSVAFQGGEPTLRGLDYFRFFVDQMRARKPQNLNVTYAIQTNGLLLNEEWARFLKENDFLVGISLDGPREIHDRYRLDAGGKGTFDRVMGAIDLLRRYEVPFNTLTVVTAQACEQIGEIYDFFMENGLTYQQYIPCLDPLFEERGGQSYSLTPELFGDFLIRLFDRWYPDRKKDKFVYIHYFEALAGMLLGYPAASCGMNGVCSNQNVIEADGRVYPCDFYCLDEYCIGDIRTDSFATMDKRRRPFLEASLGGLEKCRACRFGNICRGGCRRDRQGPDALVTNPLCPGYERFFEYALPKLKNLIR